ncbi:MAG: PorT family protein [Bacteroidales bacterium]|nr:PorT family protein [Bacteroidales bacterium]MCF8327203.1 PorT family protein [Bacteroidales bacterium]
MKKIMIATLALMMLWPFGKIQAQEDNKPFRFGLHASPSVTWSKPDLQEYESAGTRLGFSYGMLAEFSMSNNYSLSTGIDISYFGGKLSYIDSLNNYSLEDDDNPNIKTAEIKSTYSLQYLQIPVMIKMSTNEIGYFTYFANVGLGTSIRLGASVEDIYDPAGDKNDDDNKIDDLSEDVALFRESLIIGLGAEYSLGPDISLLGAVNFNNGFTTTIKRDNYQLDKRGNAIVNYIEFKFGLLF